MATSPILADDGSGGDAVCTNGGPDPGSPVTYQDGLVGDLGLITARKGRPGGAACRADTRTSPEARRLHGGAGRLSGIALLF